MDWASSSSSYTGTIMDRPNIFEGDAPMEDNTSGYPESGTLQMNILFSTAQGVRDVNLKGPLPWIGASLSKIVLNRLL